jgi:hypothetical protein
VILLVLPGTIGLALIAWGLYLLFHRPAADFGNFYATYPRAVVKIGNRTFRAAVADNIGRRAQGLSGRGSMAEDEAMLFDFPITMKYSFHTKDMKFPLDIIWIRNGRIVDISEDVPVRCPKVKPRSAVDMVLEVNAGLVRRFGIKTGDRVEVVGNR